MKKFGRILLTLVVLLVITSTIVLFVSASSNSFLLKNVTSITVTGNEAMTTSPTTTSADAIALFAACIKSGTPIKEAPMSTTHTGNIRALSSGSSADYKLLVSGEYMYLSKDGSYLGISRSDWNNFTTNIGDGLYKFSALPTAGVNGTPVPVTASTYAYQKMDGYYYTPKVAEGYTLPTIELSAGNPLTLATSPSSLNTTITVQQGGKNIWIGSNAEFSSFTPPKAGSYKIYLVSNYTTDYYSGTTTFAFNGNYKTVVGKISFSIGGSSTYPGEITVLRIKGAPQGTKPNFQSDLPFTPKFFREVGGDYIALMPVSYFNSVGSYNASITVGDYSSSLKITVNDKKFQIQNLTVDSQTSSETIESAKANEEYENTIAPLRGVADSTPYWQGTDFVWPVGKNSRVTTEFGMIRYVNGKPTSVRHGAIDFAVPLGTTVNATNNGRVLYSGFLQLTGNTVLIEHGYGLKSWHYHMDSRNVSTGDMVVAGQKIGEVGTTGFSTGPHLHFGMSVNNVFVNPATVIDGGLI